MEVAKRGYKNKKEKVNGFYLWFLLFAFFSVWISYKLQNIYAFCKSLFCKKTGSINDWLFDGIYKWLNEYNKDW